MQAPKRTHHLNRQLDAAREKEDEEAERGILQIIRERRNETSGDVSLSTGL
jgi:hypothetical protein